jgi:hypothetical protein
MKTAIKYQIVPFMEDSPSIQRKCHGNFIDMFKTWVKYLSIDFQESHRNMFFLALNTYISIPKYYVFFEVGSLERAYCLSTFKSILMNWKYLMSDNESYYSDEKIIRSRQMYFFSTLSREFPSIFDYLFNIWIEEIDGIIYHYTGEYQFSEEDEGECKKINIIQYLIMKLRGQIV